MWCVSFVVANGFPVFMKSDSLSLVRLRQFMRMRGAEMESLVGDPVFIAIAVCRSFSRGKDDFVTTACCFWVD